MAGTNRRAPARGKRSAPRGSTGSSSRSGATKKPFFDYPRTGFHGLHRWLPSWRVVLGTILGIAFLGMGAMVAAYASTDVPNPADDTRAQTTTVYYADNADGTPGAVMGTFATQKREIVEYPTLPDYVGQSVAAAEDKTFFTNNSGVSITGMGRAFLNNLRGGKTQGGSTLTQQYVERYYVDKTTTDYVGKFKETLLAMKIAKTESKAEIMGRYLNTIYWGRDSYGIQAAAQSYFGVNAADLTLAQSAMLAGIIPSPNNWDPAVSPEKAQARWNIVLDSMEEQGWLTAADRAAMVFPPTVEYQRSETMRGPAGYLLEMVLDELKAPPLALTEDEINRQGLKVVTTIQQPLQASAEAQVAAFRAGTLPEQDGATPANDRLRVSITSVDPKDGAIVALYGGPDFLADQKNTATFDAIQPGSTFKPFALIAGLENGVSLSTRFNGRSPQTFGDWEVNNFSGEDFGNIDLVEATAQSVNTVYAQLNLQVGPEKTAEVAERAGVPAPVDTNRSNVLGTESVHPKDIAGAYATLASGGVRVDPYIVRTVREPRRLRRVPAQGPHRARLRAGRDRRRDLRHDAGRREGLRQAVDQAAGPPDRGQDRDVAVQQVGVVRRLHAEHRDGGLAQPGGDRRQVAGDDRAVRRPREAGGHRWSVAGVPVAVLHEGRLRAAAVLGSRRLPAACQRRCQAEADPSPGAHRDGDADAGAHAGGADRGDRAVGPRGQARGRRHRVARQRRPRCQRGDRALRHRDQGPCHPHGPGGRGDGRTGQRRDARRVHRSGRAGDAEADGHTQADPDTDRPGGGTGGTLIVSRSGSDPQPISAGGRGRVALQIAVPGKTRRHGRAAPRSDAHTLLPRIDRGREDQRRWV